MGGEITLSDALEQIEANNIRERTDGLANLKHVLRNNSKFDTLSDDSIHRVYEVLFRIAVSEQSAYLKAKTTTTRSAAENRLSTCANALRLAVEAGVRSIRLKTVRSLFDHIIGTLPLPGGTFCEPLALDYAKCMRAILRYQPHVEHLKQPERERVALFCVDCIQKANRDGNEDDEYDAAPGAEVTSTAGTTNGLSYRSSRSHYKDSGGSQAGRSLGKQIAEEMVASIALLTAPPNAANGHASGTLLWALIEFLKKNAYTGQSQTDAFAAINHILSWTRTEDTELTGKATGPLVRLIRHYWAVKSDKCLSPFRYEVLITCIYLRPYFFSMMQREDAVTLRSELSGLLDTLKSEYRERKEPDQLHMEDLRLGFGDAHKKNTINTAIFRLRCIDIRSEAKWTLILILASLCSILSDETMGDKSSDGEDGEEIDTRPRKRQRLTDEFEETLNHSASGDLSSRVCALKTLTFLAQQKALSTRQLTKAIDKSSISCADDNVVLASWALLALSSLASQALCSQLQLSSRWSSVWQLAFRAMSNAYTCRQACHLLQIMLKLKLVSQQSTSELVQTVTSSMDQNGPSALADSVLHLLSHVVQIAQQTHPTSSTATAEGILGWLFRIYLPSKFEDKAYVGQHLLFEPGDLVKLITCCIGQHDVNSTALEFPVWDAIGQKLLACAEQEELVTYLLLLPETTNVSGNNIKLLEENSKSPQQIRVSCETIVLNNLLSELDRAQAAWKPIMHDKPQSITLNMFTFFCNMCCVSTCIAFSLVFRDHRRQSQLQRRMQDFLQVLAEFIASPDCAQDKVDVMLKTLSCACTGLLDATSSIETMECENRICRTIHTALESRKSDRDFNGSKNDEDLMELEDRYDSQDSRRDNEQVSDLFLESDLTVSFSNSALRSTVALYAAAITTLENHASDKRLVKSASTSITDYMLSLPETSILSSRHVISELSAIGIELLTDDSYRLLNYCSENILQAYPYERSEVATGAILDIMSSLVSAWTNPEDNSLFDLGIDMYDWYTKIALSGGILSPSVQNRVATLLLQLCHVDTDYGRDNNVSSVRTSLFTLVQLGSISVQFHLAEKISTIFGLFVLSNHSAMFDDLQEKLPSDAEWIEGMAMRLLFLAKLASAWHSLLRQCVYYIFETAGRVKASAKHAARSISGLANSVHFESPQKLFTLFAPQLLHTWLENHTVNSLPFGIFQYESLKALIAQNQSEFVAQLLIRGNDQGMQAVMSALDASSRDLVTASFAKCQAYSICWDISRPPTSGNEDSCESRLRKVIGNKEEYKRLVMDHFATIMGYFFLSLSQENIDDKWLEKRTDYSFAAKALAQIKSFSHSDRALPPTQQPSFKSKYLCDQIERLCRRTLHDPLKPWDVSSFSLAVRVLLDSVENALGPLHTCIVIRKLRMLISMGGEVTTSGFPLEMLIHALRPFLSDSQCADDTIGILQYLFYHGQQHLRVCLAFLCGTATLMILQMRKHSIARQESTTQESQHRSTVQRMEKFQTWLVKYLQQCQPSDSSHTTVNYERLVKALAQINLPGNARKGSPESELLLLLLDQVSTDDALLIESDQEEALSLLSDGFEMLSSVTEDCLADDDRCIYFAPKLWRVIQVPSLSQNFIAWAAGVLGRAYASTGKRPLDSYVQHQRSLLVDSKQYEGVARSQVAIAKQLSALLYSKTRSEASVADYTLRSVVLSFGNAEDALAFEQMLPSTIVPAIAGGTYGYEPSSTLAKVTGSTEIDSFRRLLEPSSESSLETWVQELSVAICKGFPEVAIVSKLNIAIQYKAQLALDILPRIVHIILATELGKEPALRSQLSTAIAAHLADNDIALRSKQRYLLRLLLYLRAQVLPGEKTRADRLGWLEVDWLAAAQAANKCDMPTVALLFAESASQPAHGARRSSSRASLSQSQISMAQVPQELLLSTFKSVEEPDSFYGVEQAASLDSVLDRLDYEEDGFRSLMFRSALTDTRLRRTHRLVPEDSSGMVHSLSVLNLNSLTFALLSSDVGLGNAPDDLLNSARRLQQWDIVPPESTSPVASNNFNAFQELSRANDRMILGPRLQRLMIAHTNSMTALDRSKKPSYEWFSVLAALLEAFEVINASGQSAIRSIWQRMMSRQTWMQMARFEDFRSILSDRHTLFSVLSQNQALSTNMRVGLKHLRTIEVESLLNYSRFARDHGQIQEALAATSQISDLLANCQDISLKADAAAKLETASVLWSAGEVTTSVKMLQEALAIPNLESQDVPVGRSGLLAQLAHQLAEARLEKPDEILLEYLKPAISQLQGRTEGQEAGKVYHEFALFCDKQLQNPGNLQDLNRVSKLRQRKLEEVEELESMSKVAKRPGGEKSEYTRDLNKAKQLFDMDDAEYQRLRRNQDTYMQQSLQNYLLTLRASDEYDISVLRFFALWFENSDVVAANAIVTKNLGAVPNWKFVVLMNQLMSRLESNNSAFQSSLRALASRLCSEHPHHSLHHLYATTRKPPSKDQAAESRWRVGMQIRKQVNSDSQEQRLLESIFAADNQYNMLAKVDGNDFKGSQVSIKDVPAAMAMVRKVPDLRVPPPTINVPLNRDGDYSNVPNVTKFGSVVRFMSGISKPKRITAYASDGQQYVLLLKGGNDDLRQDAIMEQVFEEVSKMLRNHKSTRQRNLHVRTYKVIPLSKTSGIIEFVPNSTSFSDFLVPAHERYHPQDLKYNVARGKIESVKSHSTETRIKEFRKVCEHMQPVLRHFFFERYTDPDEWFEKRTAYTRTTATISILGHVLGLGDRHCQNIMLDEKTGEVVHIDLGVAFEAGRVLPIPELVPFRLSRDVIDGMGIMKTEGIFRRCSEFTMDALREDKDSIMTLLNVLRYDPLYAWTVSPLRAKRMQEETGRNGAEGDAAEGSSRKKEQEAGEADRALSIVEKKLSKTLSTAATVNELIQQATDERNLATLFQGWAAFF